MNSQTENVSRTGVLFRAERLLEAGTLMELVLDLRRLTKLESAEVLCRGRVVRAIPGGASPPSSCEIAVSIEAFTFLRGADLPVP